MKNIIFLASFFTFFVSSVEAHNSDTPYNSYPHPSGYEVSNHQSHNNSYRVPSVNYSTPIVYNAQYAPSQIRRVQTTQPYQYNNSYSQGTTYAANTYAANTYSDQDFYRTNGSRYDLTTTNVAPRTTSYNAGRTLYEPTRPTYAQTYNCNY